jgi:hypothetical protein
MRTANQKIRSIRGMAGALLEPVDRRVPPPDANPDSKSSLVTHYLGLDLACLSTTSMANLLLKPKGHQGPHEVGVLRVHRGSSPGL